MKGIVMNILAEMVETQLGLEEWNNVLDEADESGIYTSTVIYDDERLLNLVGILSQRNNIPASDLVFAFGQSMIPAFLQALPTADRWSRSYAGFPGIFRQRDPRRSRQTLSWGHYARIRARPTQSGSIVFEVRIKPKSLPTGRRPDRWGSITLRP